MVSDFHRELDALCEKPQNYLAISGRGANGAFGVGLLVGWTATGKRPEFSMVTGVRTEALTAPFAFLEIKEGENASGSHQPRQNRRGRG